MNTKCPVCHTEFDAKRSQKGASYAKEWVVLPTPNLRLLKWWYYNYPTKEIDKKKIVSEYGFVTIDSVNARVSELYACGLIDRTVNKEYYVLVGILAEKVIMNNGRLK